MTVATSAENAQAPRRDIPPSMVGRMTLILDAFDGRTARLTLEDVARRTRLPRSTAHRILDQLVKLDWLEHTPLGYGLGRRALALAGRANDHGDLRACAASVLHGLHLRTGMVVHLGVLEGADVHYLDKVGGRLAAFVPSAVGGRAPAHTTALGKAMLAWLEPEQVDALLGGVTGQPAGRMVGDLPAFHHELHRIRQRRGLAFERGELAFERGERVPAIACVAVAVPGPDGPVAGISLAGDVRAPLERMAPLVVDAARQVSLRLYPSPAARRSRRRLTVVPRTEPWPREMLDRLMATGADDWL